MTAVHMVRRHALALPGAEEHDHWGKPSFRVGGKIFATLHAKERRAVVKLSRGDQAMRSETRPEAYAPVPSWGHQGWTFVMLDAVDGPELRAVLALAWRTVAPKRLVVDAEKPADSAKRPVRAPKRSPAARRQAGRPR
jgi:hypothetical protein